MLTRTRPTSARTPLVYVAGIFMIGSHVMVQQRARAPYRGLWSLPVRILTDSSPPEQVLRDMAKDCGHLQLDEAHVCAIDSISAHRDGVIVPMIHILYKAQIRTPMRPEIDAWGASQKGVVQMCHLQKLSRYKMAFGHEKYLKVTNGEYE